MSSGSSCRHLAGIAHAISGALLCLTIIGIPLGLANFKMIPISLFPLGEDIVPTRTLGAAVATGTICRTHGDVRRRRAKSVCLLGLTLTLGAGNRATIGRMGRTVLVVDDHAEFRWVARGLLEAGGFSVVGEAGDGETALAAAERLGPDVVLLDVQLPGLDGFAVAEQLIAEHPPHPLVVLVSSRSSSSYRRRLAVSPAVGFLSKGDFSSAAFAALLPAVGEDGGG